MAFIQYTIETPAPNYTVSQKVVNRYTKHTPFKIYSHIQHTCLPTACVADFPEAAVGFSCVAGIPEAQVTTKTLHVLYFFLV